VGAAAGISVDIDTMGLGEQAGCTVGVAVGSSMETFELFLPLPLPLPLPDDGMVGDGDEDADPLPFDVF
jgi:hypothetical protein